MASARAGNVIGGGDWTRHALIVDAFKALATEKAIEIRSPQALRPWQHVLQCLSGYLTLAAKLLDSNDPDACSGWNIGPMPGNELPVQEVVQHFIKCWGSGEFIDAADPYQLPEANIRGYASTKDLKLNWRPCWSTYQSIAKTVDWYRAFLKHRVTSVTSACHRSVIMNTP